MDKLKPGLKSKADYLKLAVVGHTNTGKTSLLRTLTHDTGFGEVSARPSATRHVEEALRRLRPWFAAQPRIR